MKVTMYKSSDGQLHASHEAYAEREAALKMLPQLKMMTDEADPTVFSEDDRGNLCLFTDDIPNFIVTHANDLRVILNDAVITKRGRKPKGE
jgi:hypothetical protein